MMPYPRGAPAVRLDTPAVVLVGAPNVGKSSIVHTRNYVGNSGSEQLPLHNTWYDTRSRGSILGRWQLGRKSRGARRRSEGKSDNGGAGSGWSDDGKACLYDDLFCRVKENWTMHGKTFNQELLKIYQQQRNKGNGGNMTKQANPKNKRRHRCLNELKDADDEEEQEHIHYHNSTSTKSSSVGENNVDDTYIKSEAV